MTEQLVGQLLDALNVNIEPSDGQQLTEALVIGKIVDIADDSGKPRLVICTSEGMDWIAQLGLIAATQQVMNESEVINDDGDD